MFAEMWTPCYSARGPLCPKPRFPSGAFSYPDIVGDAVMEDFLWELLERVIARAIFAILTWVAKKLRDCLNPKS